MSSVVVHFPDGSREFRFPQEPLQVGDVLWHETRSYRVLHVASDDGGKPVVTVEPEPDGLGDTLRSEKGAIELVAID